MKEEILNYNFLIKVFEDRDAMGKAAAQEAAKAIKNLLKEKEEINCIFAAAPSQNEFLKYLIEEEIDWTRVNAFHMDEYIGLPKGDKRLFANFLKEHIFDEVPFKKLYLINDCGSSQEEIINNYVKLLEEHVVDFTFMGIGENGHIAFNDPHVAFFNDEEVIKVVDLDNKCRMQQVNDGCFATLEEVPKYALTLTIPALMKAKEVFCMVPGPTKAEAVKNTVLGPLGEACPATIMRKHNKANLYLDKESARDIL